MQATDTWNTRMLTHKSVICQDFNGWSFCLLSCHKLLALSLHWPTQIVRYTMQMHWYNTIHLHETRFIGRPTNDNRKKSSKLYIHIISLFTAAVSLRNICLHTLHRGACRVCFEEVVISCCLTCKYYVRTLSWPSFISVTHYEKRCVVMCKPMF